MIEDMILNGELRELVIDLVKPTSRLGWQTAFADNPHDPVTRSEDMLKKQPMAGIVKLLADPYLRMARLFVNQDHRMVWCRWHDAEECLAGAGDVGIEADNSLTEINWRRILSELDPEGVEIAKDVSASRR